VDDSHNLTGPDALDALSPSPMIVYNPEPEWVADHAPPQGTIVPNRVGGPVPNDPLPVNWPPTLQADGTPNAWDAGRGPATSEPTSWDAPPFQMPPGQQDSTPNWDPPGGEVTRLGGGS